MKGLTDDALALAILRLPRSAKAGRRWRVTREADGTPFLHLQMKSSEEAAAVATALMFDESDAMAAEGIDND